MRIASAARTHDAAIPRQVATEQHPDARRQLSAVREARFRATHQMIAVTAGESLSSIAAARWGSSKLWPALWWVNRHRVPDPNVLAVPRLHLPLSHRLQAWKVRRADAAAAPPAQPASPVGSRAPPVSSQPAPPVSAGVYSYGQLEALWVSAGGPSWAEASAATIAECESGGNPRAYNPSGASGLWQILGQVVAGNIFDPMVNALNAVSKFRASGDTFAQWVCQATAQSTGAKLLSATVTTPKRWLAFRWAKAHEAGHWYCWGGTGPSCYDCSGAVQRAYSAIGIWLPRTVSDMIHSGRLYRISASQARKGDLVTWGEFHVEFVAYRWRWTFGAHDSGSRVSSVRTWSYPHTFWRVRRAG
jgi:cell wall-associated NlpC family hydrolase